VILSQINNAELISCSNYRGNGVS